MSSILPYPVSETPFTGGRHTEVGRARSHLNLARHTEVRSSKFREKFRSFAKPHFRLRNHLKELLYLTSDFSAENGFSRNFEIFRETSNFELQCVSRGCDVNERAQLQCVSPHRKVYTDEGMFLTFLKEVKEELTGRIGGSVKLITSNPKPPYTSAIILGTLTENFFECRETSHRRVVGHTKGTSNMQF
eukprot:sb/3471204/